MCRGPKAAQPGDNVSVNLSGVSLPRHDEAARESRLGSDQLVKTLDLLVVTIKQLEEGGLGPGGALHPPEPQPVPGKPQVLLVNDKLLKDRVGILSMVT